jgi:hypothetical protein
MAYVDRHNPWNPGYAMPNNVLDEPLGRGVRVTKYLPRRTISEFNPSWITGGREAMGHTEGIFAGSKSGGIFSSRGKLGVLGGHTLSPDGLGQAPAKQAAISIGSKQDPIANFGRESAKLILSELRTVGVEHRKDALKIALDAIDSKIYTDVAERAERLKKEKGYDAKTAVEKALAAAMANHYLVSLIKAGQGTPAGGVLSLASLGGCAKCCRRIDETMSHLALSGFWGSFSKIFTTPVKYVGKAAKGIVKGVGKLACKAAKSNVVGIAATTAGAVYGGPVGAAAAQQGTSAAKSLCTKNPKGAVDDPSMAETPVDKFKSMLPILLIGGGALAVVLIATRK